MDSFTLTGPFPVEGVSGYFFIIIIMFYRTSCIECKQCRRWSYAAVSKLFANVLFMGR